MNEFKKPLINLSHHKASDLRREIRGKSPWKYLGKYFIPDYDEQHCLLYKSSSLVNQRNNKLQFCIAIFLALKRFSFEHRVISSNLCFKNHVTDLFYVKKYELLHFNSLLYITIQLFDHKKYVKHEERILGKFIQVKVA